MRAAAREPKPSPPPPGEVKSLESSLPGPRATKNASVAKMEHGGCMTKMLILLDTENGNR